MSLLTVGTGSAAINLIPQPVELKESQGAFVLTSASTIGYDDPAAKTVADMLAGKLRIPTGYALSAGQRSDASIQFRLSRSADQQLGREGYTLTSSPNAIVITANEPAGLFYGMQTLLQLLPKEIERAAAVKAEWTIPSVTIRDYPRFAWRGIMLDVARNFRTKEEVKRYIDQISRFKYNTLHWHLTDDEGWRIEIKSLPNLTNVGAWRVPRAGYFGQRSAPKPGEAATEGGFYTQEDVKDVIAYAKERFISILPEVDVPGHSMAAVASYPELSCTKDTSTRPSPGMHFAEWYGNGTFKMFVDNTLNPSDENVYKFLDKVFTELAALFPSPYIHVGGDECYKGYWERNEGCRELMRKLKIRHVEDLQGYFMGRVNDILKAKGKKLIGWDEILEGGVSQDAAVMSWRGMRGGIEAAKAGHYVVMTPSSHVYIDYTQGDPTIDPPVYANLRMKTTYSFEPVPEGVDAKYILGGQGNLWAEQLPTMRSIEYMSYPRAWALSEILWSPKGTNDWQKFTPRVEAFFERADAADVNYSRAMYDAIVATSMKKGKMMLEIESEAPGLDLYYTVDGTMPDDHSPKFTEPVQLPDGPITVRVVTYRGGKPIGHLITLGLDELKKRVRGR